MKNKQGYAVKELIILCSVLGVVFAIATARVSFAYQLASDEERIEDLKYETLLEAAEQYAKKNPEKFKSVETFLYGGDLIEAGFLMDLEEFDYKNTKIKIVYDDKTKTYKGFII